MAKAQSDESIQMLAKLKGNDPLERVYLFYGEDSYTIDRLIDALIEKRFRGSAPDPLSFEQYRAGETETARVIDAIRTVSMFGGSKVVIFRDIERLVEDDLARLSAYAAAPVKAHLILTARKIDERKKSYKALKPATVSVNCAPLNERHVSAYIQEEARTRSLMLSAGAADALAECIGPNRALIARAFEKLSLAVGSAAPITTQHITEHVFDTRERKVFEISQAIAKRDIASCLNALHILIEQKQEPIAINGFFARQARTLLIVKLGLLKKLPQDDIMQRADIRNPYAMREYHEAASNYTLGELYQFHSAVYEADRSLKSKPVPALFVLSRVLMTLMPQTR
ncbi:MAG: DNA polymerase III subunit delta [Proteobacteria bacterium]|nr:DNA polymerase III subunit delta [Pseudomonadota bacterium]